MRSEGTNEEQLVDVIRAWRAHRHPRLGDLADAIGRSITPPPLPATKRKKDLLGVWLERERARNPADFGLLAAQFGEGSQEDVVARVVKLAEWDDPRLSRALIALLEDPPYAGVKSRSMLKAIIDGLEGTRDPRVPLLARELAGRYLQIVQSGTGTWVVDQLQRVAERLEALPTPELPSDIEAACARLEDRIGPDALAEVRGAEQRAAAKGSLAGLFAAVYAAPSDDAPRLVLADALIEQGDPRGELIALQIDRANGTIDPVRAAREREIRRDHGRLAAWAQPLSSVGDCTFERGFPARIRLYSKPVKSALGHPSWSTLETIDGLGGWPHKTVIEMLSRPTLAHLREPGTLTAKVVNELAMARRDWPYTKLGVASAHEIAREALASFPHVVRLALQAQGAAPDFVTGGAVRSLAVRIHHPVREDALWSLPTALDELAIDVHAPLPRGALAGQEKLRRLDLSLSTQEGVAAAIARLASLRVLHLKLGSGGYDASLFASLGELEELTLSYARGSQLAPGALDALSALRKLDVRHLDVPPGAFAALGRLDMLVTAAAADVPATVRTLHLSTLPEPASLEALLARLPRLEEVQIPLDRRQLDEIEPLVAILARSKIARFAVEDFHQFFRVEGARVSTRLAGEVLDRLVKALPRVQDVGFAYSVTEEEHRDVLAAWLW